MSQQAAAYLVPEPDPGLLDAGRLRAAMSILGISELREVYRYRGASDWQTPYEDLLRLPSLKRLMPEEFVTVAYAEATDTLLSAEFIAEELLTIIDRLLETAPASIRRWVPQFGQIKVGSHSMPDYEFEETVWAGTFSFSIYGNRMPEEPDILIELLNADPDWKELAARLGAVLGTRMVTRMEVSY